MCGEVCGRMLEDVALEDVVKLSRRHNPLQRGTFQKHGLLMSGWMGTRWRHQGESKEKSMARDARQMKEEFL
ncbi:hypothetical protein RRG08_015525 [Elysia crispata]|uniref:Uncharacterized protein n=1 Tax=Elysia crispata TaxID=231223 RepID=A0AAE0YKK4_9GAST|nr:hypothetical protein RRG08_015525 [Elysia crispata]